MALWSELPVDIRQRILELVAQGVQEGTNGTVKRVGNSGGRQTSLSLYATVCRQWQSLFEKKIYRHLFLKPSLLEHLGSLSHRRREMVEYIWLKISLKPYDCPNCTGFYGHDDEYNNRVTKEAIVTLFYILSTWDEAQSPGSSGLTPHISAYSPSDSQHVFHTDLYFDTSPFSTRELESERPLLTDIGHGWKDGRRTTLLNIASVSRLFWCSLTPNLAYQLPYVGVVKSFVIRRQTRVKIGHTALHEIMRSLKNITTVHIEPWRDFICYPQNKYTFDRGKILNPFLPVRPH